MSAKIMVGNTMLGELHYLTPSYYIAHRTNKPAIGFWDKNRLPDKSTYAHYEFKPSMKHRKVVIYRCAELEEMLSD